ncbi:hypothetical protein LTR95_002907 [Oleoguttula sp. CCFEE 5521]
MVPTNYPSASTPEVKYRRQSEIYWIARNVPQSEAVTRHVRSQLKTIPKIAVAPTLSTPEAMTVTVALGAALIGLLIDEMLVAVLEAMLLVEALKADSLVAEESAARDTTLDISLDVLVVDHMASKDVV